ncbi:hypothetical protein HU200_003349 [Digitaria exilis]|uniref:Uncharacterized protein n=1 Tax=Digitaria exilis TaxID=1010633 RepID=A0A835FY28_9POAL|nr:hypothetical protein HU200_003349 [Digitaria exilis]
MSRQWSFTCTWLVGRELQLSPKLQYDAALLILWHLWKARNARIFDNQHLNEWEILRHVVRDMDLWRRRFKHDQALWEAWRNHICSCL